jgi:hypothetical protein
VGARATPEDVERELWAQIRLAQSWGLKPQHMDNHMGSLFTRPEFLAIFYRIAVETGIPPLLADLSPEEIRAINPNLDVGSMAFLDPLKQIFPVLKSFSAVEHGSLDEKRASATQKLSRMGPGLHEIILHPAELTDELRTITQSAEDRDRDRQLMLDHGLAQAIEKSGARITNWGEAAREKAQ